jgi:hypothetical protein
MKQTLGFAVLLVWFTASVHAAEVDIPITVSDGVNGTQELRFGMDPSATDGIDPALGEARLPPLPPTGAFDARFVGDDIGISLGNGSIRDYRQGTLSTTGTRIHEIKYQVGSGTTIAISWSFPGGVVGRLQDLILGTLIDVPMIGTGSYTVNNPGGFSKLKMTIAYTPPVPIQATIQSNPQGDSVIVDGTKHLGPVSFSWPSGSNHTIGTDSLQNKSAEERHVWISWSDGGPISHVVAPTGDSTFSASFDQQYYLTTQTQSNLVSPASGWQKKDTSISILAIKLYPGYGFSQWAGSGPGAYTGTDNPATITMGGPITEVATWASCMYPLSHYQAYFPATGGQDSFAVIPTRQCSWRIWGVTASGYGTFLQSKVISPQLRSMLTQI